MRSSKQHEIMTHRGVPLETYCGIPIRSARQAHRLGTTRGLLCVACHPDMGQNYRRYRLSPRIAAQESTKGFRPKAWVKS